MSKIVCFNVAIFYKKFPKFACPSIDLSLFLSLRSTRSQSCQCINGWGVENLVRKTKWIGYYLYFCLFQFNANCLFEAYKYKKYLNRESQTMYEYENKHRGIAQLLNVMIFWIPMNICIIFLRACNDQRVLLMKSISSIPFVLCVLLGIFIFLCGVVHKHFSQNILNKYIH